MKRCILAALLLTLSSSVFAQYKNAVGLRFNGGYGITFKHNKSSKTALEGILSGYGHGINAALLYEIHNADKKTPGFRWYYGAGGHIGIWRDYHGRAWWYDETRSGVALGADGILGIEYTFSEIPLNLSLDWKPAINIIPRPDIFVGDVGLSIRVPFR